LIILFISYFTEPAIRRQLGVEIYITQPDFQGSRFSPGGTVSPVGAVGSINSTCCTFSVASFCTAASSDSRSRGVISNRLLRRSLISGPRIRNGSGHKRVFGF